MNTAKYDLIGDVHGITRTLLHALGELGYRKTAGRWSHPDGRVLVSVGDLIDRGYDPLGALETVCDLVRDGCGAMVLGNHEINALHYLTQHRGTGQWLRDHSTKNDRQFENTLAQIRQDPDRWDRLQAQLTRIPTRLELDAGRLRVVHACWGHGDLSVDDLPRFLDSPEALENTADEAGRHRCWRALECCIKGPEESSEPFEDKDGNRRTTRRVKWWKTYPQDAPFVVFGHYWFRQDSEDGPETPGLLGPGQNAACLDFSLGKGGELGALRWPEKELLTFDYSE